MVAHPEFNFETAASLWHHRRAVTSAISFSYAKNSQVFDILNGASRIELSSRSAPFHGGRQAGSARPPHMARRAPGRRRAPRAGDGGADNSGPSQRPMFRQISSRLISWRHTHGIALWRRRFLPYSSSHRSSPSVPRDRMKAPPVREKPRLGGVFPLFSAALTCSQATTRAAGDRSSRTEDESCQSKTT